jgi:hypothetical protein
MLNRLVAVPWYGLAALGGVAAAQPPALTYDSPYAAYRPYRDEPLASWRESNDTLAQPAAPAASPSSGPQTGHSGHTQPSATRNAAPSGQAPAAAHGQHR